MKKRFAPLLAAVCLIFALAVSVSATQTEASAPQRAEDQCGEELRWRLEEDVLYIEGTGAMDDGSLWQEKSGEITKVVFSGNVTYIGAEAFAGFEKLAAVEFGSGLVEIGKGAFRDCTALEEVSLPGTFRKFGEECFQLCYNLERVNCAGPMPSFRQNCLWTGSPIEVRCPAENLWPESYVQELETNFGGRLQVKASDGTDPFDFTEPTQAATEETLEPTQAATEAATEAPTEAPTEAVEETQAATLPTEERAETTAPETQSAAPETTGPAEETVPPATEQREDLPPTAEGSAPGASGEKEVSGTRIGLYILAGVMAFLGLGVLVFGRKKGGKYVR